MGILDYNSHIWEKENKMSKYRFRDVRDEYNECITNKKEKLTQKNMAEYCCIGKSTISRIERGEIEPSLNVLIGYSDKFNVSMDYLLGRSNAKDVKNCTVSNELGLSDSAIETLKDIKNSSFNDLLDIINAFIGSDEHTVMYFSNLLTILAGEQALSDIEDETAKMITTRTIEQNMTNFTIEYIKQIIQPQITKVIEDCYKGLKAIHESNELYTQQELDEMNAQLEEIKNEGMTKE